MDIERYQKHRCQNCINYDICLKMCNETDEYKKYDDGYYCKTFDERT